MGMAEPGRRRITLAILALGGQGGGVLADWILAVGEAAGWRTQGTSVPGVAQRTGSTVYYIELHPEAAADPVLALNPVPGDVDIVVASELMEAGRAILRGFVTDRTVLIGSTHRIYAIAEKSARGDGRIGPARVLEAAQQRARRFIGFDMDAAAARAGSVISSVMLGALAASGALPFERAAFEAAIRAGGIAVEPNLRGFAAGWEAATTPAAPVAAAVAAPAPTTPGGRRLAARIVAELPAAAQALALRGVHRLVDYQDVAYADLYLDRLQRIAGVSGHDGPLVAIVARYLALWMSYEDTVRVADLKTRGSRAARVRGEVGAPAGQLLGVTEFMHPRLQEVCETLPVALGRYVLASPRLQRLLAPLFGRGRHVRTTRLGWFILLYGVAQLRRFRRGSLRFHDEQARIADWLALVAETAATDRAAACELAEAPRLIKGYSDTFERGLAHYAAVIATYRAAAGSRDAAAQVRAAREAALADSG